MIPSAVDAGGLIGERRGANVIALAGMKFQVALAVMTFGTIAGIAAGGIGLAI